MKLLDRLACLWRGHVPYVEPEQGRSMVLRHRERNAETVVGYWRRYCGRCSATLDGKEPEVGDRRRLA